MSHIVSIAVLIKDREMIDKACEKLGFEVLGAGTYRLFSQQVEGYAIKLPEWEYPVVTALDTGVVSYDNYNGAWGREETLNRFLQQYGVEKTRSALEAEGYSVYEKRLDDGNVQLETEVI